MSYPECLRLRQRFLAAFRRWGHTESVGEPLTPEMAQILEKALTKGMKPTIACLFTSTAVRSATTNAANCTYLSELGERRYPQANRLGFRWSGAACNRM
jgi:hypothetical protein